jgi:glycosyltransferase involved in cell wall biosynthesis
MMEFNPPISVIVPAYNAEHTMDQCLQALKCQTIPKECYEIIVVDDGSTDGTPAKVNAYDNVRLFSQTHAGPAAARNLGMAHARGEIILFTDADCEPTPDWIERMAAPFRAEVALHGDEIAGVKGAYLNRRREIVARFVQMEYEDRYDRMTQERYIDFVDTYSAGYRRDVLVANGGFDPLFSAASVEDQEFSFRLAHSGYKMIFVKEARVHHLGHARSVWAYWRKKFKIGYWKVVVCRQHPGKILRDSHTPQVLKGQIILAGLGGLCFPAGLLWSPMVWGIVVSGFLFLLTTLPFVLKTWERDPLAALVSPCLLLVRALALGTGFASGLAVNLGGKGHIRSPGVLEKHHIR